MSLLHDIQATVLQEDADLGPILLKLRLLAARLGSQPLAEWVKHESEGYPSEAEIPDYRILSVSYKANFSGPGVAVATDVIKEALLKFYGFKLNHQSFITIRTQDTHCTGFWQP